MNQPTCWIIWGFWNVYKASQNVIMYHLNWDCYQNFESHGNPYMEKKRGRQKSFKQVMFKKICSDWSTNPTSPSKIRAYSPLSAMPKKTWLVAFFFGEGIILPSYTGTFNKNPYKEPYQTTRIHWFPNGFPEFNHLPRLAQEGPVKSLHFPGALAVAYEDSYTLRLGKEIGRNPTFIWRSRILKGKLIEMKHVLL